MAERAIGTLESFDTPVPAKHHYHVRFSIITPSFRSSNWLKLCIASVADQEVEHEHIVQDAGSDDGGGKICRGRPDRNLLLFSYLRGATRQLG